MDFLEEYGFDPDSISPELKSEIEEDARIVDLSPDVFFEVLKKKLEDGFVDRCVGLIYVYIEDNYYSNDKKLIEKVKEFMLLLANSGLSGKYLSAALFGSYHYGYDIQIVLKDERKKLRDSAEEYYNKIGSTNGIDMLRTMVWAQA